MLPKVESEYISFNNGVDLVTPSWNTIPGSLKDSQNWEIGINGGLETISGYERFDGRPAPSSATYYVMAITITGSFSVGNTIQGATSGATAKVILVLENQLIITKVTGIFVAENINVSGVPQGSISAPPVNDGASTSLLRAQYKNLAADEYRADIAAVPGSGISYPFILNNIRYAFRNNVGATAANLYEQSAAGWVQVALGFELPFTSGGTIEITEGQVITGATSGATATLTRVALESGSWSAGTAVGKFIFASNTGTFQAENINVGANPNLATIAGNRTAITLLPSGKFKFVVHQFNTDRRIYGVDGVNRGFEFDGDIFVPIKTGMTNDSPSNVIAHKTQLFFSFLASVQHSVIGNPYSFNLLAGAAALSVGDNITAFQVESGSEGGAALGIYSRNSIHILYGNSSSDWNLVKYRDEIGAYENSVQQIGSTIMMDDRGIAKLSASQAYGNFSHSTISKIIKPFINTRKNRLTCSCIVREKNQYRLFFSDNYGLYITVDGNNIIGFMPVYLKHKVSSIFSQEDSNGVEVIMFGSDNGYVYQMDKGTSFDGDFIDTYFDTHFNHSKSIRTEKSYKQAVFEISGDGYVDFFFSYELDYGVAPQSNQETKTLSFDPGLWDDGGFWDDGGVWDGVSLLPEIFSLNGTAENISLKIKTSSDFNANMKISGVLLRFIYRRQLR